MKKISVIIPVYNVELYIKNCIESVINQTYKNLEIIIIDDGSTDKSGRICDEYAMLDSRIIVIHQSNSGAANAKNNGLKIATGYYLAFVDGDDYLEPTAYEFMVSELLKNDADVIQCGFNKVFVDNLYPKFSHNTKMIFNTIEYLSRYTIDWTCGLLWDKLFKRKLYENIFFEEGHKIDDEYFTYQGIMKAKKIVYIPVIIYNYRQRATGVMLDTSTILTKQQILYDKIDYLNKRRKKINNNFPELADIFNIHYLNALLILSKNENSTYQSLYMIKNQLNEYKYEHNKTKIDWNLRILLFKLKRKNIKKLLEEIDKKEKIIDTNKYFK